MATEGWVQRAQAPHDAFSVRSVQALSCDCRVLFVGRFTGGGTCCLRSARPLARQLREQERCGEPAAEVVWHAVFQTNGCREGLMAADLCITRAAGKSTGSGAGSDPRERR